MVSLKISISPWLPSWILVLHMIARHFKNNKKTLDLYQI